MPVYCSGLFVGQRVFDHSINAGSERILWTLCFTPTKEYPSLFGAEFHESSSSIIHGFYNGTTQEASMTQVINGMSTYKYRCKLTIDNSNGISYLHGTWNSLTNSDIFGKLSMICEADGPSEFLSGIWIGQSDPDDELAAFSIPVNPIRWCTGLVRTNANKWILFGSGYFNDSADIPDQPLLFFSLNGNGTLDDMEIIKTYTITDYIVKYKGKFFQDENKNYIVEGKWSNALAESHGSFVAKQHRLSPLKSYRLDICVCEVCGNLIYPGDNRWCCFQCHFSTCSGCNLNSIAIDHQHKLVVDILPNQNTAYGKTTYELIENAFKLFDSSPFLVYRCLETNKFVSLTYGEMATKCKTLRKYWKDFVPNANNDNRPFILLIANTSPAYICCLLTGLLLQSVVVPIDGTLTIEAIKSILSTTNPSIIVVSEQYFDKVSEIVSSNEKILLMIIHQNEEQFQSITNNNDKVISLTKALELGEKNVISIDPLYKLSTKTISAILSTSGSTGFPKGAIFTEELLVPNDSFTLISPFIRIDYQRFDPVILLSLISTIRYGSRRGLTNLNDMWNDIKYIRPTSLGLMPSLWNFIYKNYLSKLNRNLTGSQKENIEREMREDLGGRLIVGTTGGGSISPTVLFFIRNKLKIDLVNIYGCRECGNISRNGLIYPGVDVKLIPVDSIAEFDGIQEGEICIHSPKMINGYWAMGKNSSFIEIEGKTYYRTGDIGQLEGRTLKLIDRSGTMIKNSMGEWISPVKIENIIEQLSEVLSSFVVGHSDYSYLLVIICPSQTGSMLNEKDMLQLIRFHCVHCGLNGPEIPQAIFIERNIIWNESNGLMKEKKCRHALSKYYSRLKAEVFNQKLTYENIDNSQLNEEFVRILENILNRSLNGQINGENTFLEIGADSLSISLLCKIFHDRGIFLEPKIVYNHSLSHLQQLFANRNLIYDEIVDDIDWKFQSTLPRHIRDLISKSKLSHKKNILLTGATGFLGPILLNEIVQKTDPNTIIYCLVRATDNEHAQQRLKQDLEQCQRIHFMDWNRIYCIAGDISKQNFGLELDFYAKLIEEIGSIYHSASFVNLEMPYKALKQTNVQGTLNTLEFALKCNGKFIYVSSIGALPSENHLVEDSNGWISFTSDEISKKDGYEQTKVVAEQLLKQASDDGAHVLVIRPCTISADTITGYSNPNDFINILLRTQLEMETIVENANLNLHFVPVDYCAKVIVALSMNFNSQGKCFNLYGNHFNISVIYQILFQKFPNVNIRKVKQNQWKEFIMNNLTEKNRSWPIRDKIASMKFINEDFQQRSIDQLVQRTQDFLRTKCQLDWFQITEEDFIKSIDYMIQQKFFPSNL